MALDRHGGLGNVFHADIIAATDTPWSLHQCEPIMARVDTGNKQAYIPRILTEYDRQIARHERGHIRWPVDWAGYGLNPTEHGFAKDIWENVVNARLEAGGLRVLDSVDAIDWSGVPTPNNLKDGLKASLHMGSYLLHRTDAGQEVSDDFRQYMAQAFDTVKTYGGDAELSFIKSIVRTARLSARQPGIESIVVVWAKHVAALLPPETEFGQHAQLKQDVAEEREQAQKEADAADTPSDSDAEDANEKTLPDGGSALGLMYICDHTKSARRSARLTYRGRITDMGAIPTRLEREWTDGQIYAKRKPSLSVLIDGSGSMSWTPEMLLELCAALPATTIASYNAASLDIERRGFAGQLCVYAKAGIVASYDRLKQCSIPSSNTVDDFALAWLAKQPMFRLWVSDGAVNTGNREPVINYADVCARIQRNGRIVRVFTVKHALEAARGQAVVTYVTPAYCADPDTGFKEKLNIQATRRRGR